MSEVNPDDQSTLTVDGVVYEARFRTVGMCSGCAFLDVHCKLRRMELNPLCTPGRRLDKKHVIWVKAEPRPEPQPEPEPQPVAEYNLERTLMQVGPKIYGRKPGSFRGACYGCAFSVSRTGCVHPNYKQDTPGKYHNRGCRVDDHDFVWVQVAHSVHPPAQPEPQPQGDPMTQSGLAPARPTFKELLDAADFVLSNGKRVVEFEVLYGGAVLRCDVPDFFLVPSEQVMDYDHRTGVAVVQAYDGDGNNEGSYKLGFVKTRAAL
jgi:hypothetical protein